MRRVTNSRPIYSQLQVESDQKEIIIAQLKEQVGHLQKNEGQFYKLEDQYKALQHKYRILLQEKRITDADFRERHQMAIRNIGQFRTQVEALKADLRQYHLQEDDLQTDYNTLRSQIDQRLIQLQKLKNQLHSLYADTEELEGQHQRMQTTASGLKADNQILLSQFKKLQTDIDSVLKNNEGLQKYSKQLLNAEGLLKQKILAYEKQNNQLDEDINQIIEDLNNIDRELHDSMAQIKHIQSDIAQISAINDKFKSEALHYHKSQQSEVMRNNDLSKNINQAQNTTRVRANQIHEGRSQTNSLKTQNQNLQQVNSRLEDDIEFCRRHLENLSLLNQDLVQHLEKFSEQDQVVRNLIDRRLRVEKARTVVADANRYSKTLTATQDTTHTFIRNSRVRY